MDRFKILVDDNERIGLGNEIIGDVCFVHLVVPIIVQPSHLAVTTELKNYLAHVCVAG